MVDTHSFFGGMAGCLIYRSCDLAGAAEDRGRTGL